MDATQMRIRREKAMARRTFVALLTSRSEFTQTAMLEQAVNVADSVRTSASIDDIRWSVEVCEASFAARFTPGYLLH